MSIYLYIYIYHIYIYICLYIHASIYECGVLDTVCSPLSYPLLRGNAKTVIEEWMERDGKSALAKQSVHSTQQVLVLPFHAFCWPRVAAGLVHRNIFPIGRRRA
jgi:hypothetical protein